MCLGGGGSSYEYKEPERNVWESDYDAAPDTVNNKLVSASGDFSQEATKNLQPKRAQLNQGYYDRLAAKQAAEAAETTKQSNKY